MLEVLRGAALVAATLATGLQAGLYYAFGPGFAGTSRGRRLHSGVRLSPHPLQSDSSNTPHGVALSKPLLITCQSHKDQQRQVI
ncbi:MAG: hypothetical protein ACRDTH_12065 [Pseudonocardiaceae bacterium]